MKKRLIALALCGLLLVAVGCSKKDSEEKAVAKPTVSVAGATRGAIARSKQFEGTLAAQSEVMVAVPTPGKVLSSQVNVGSKVKKGDLLFAMDPKDVAVQKKTGQAQYNVAKKSADAANQSLNELKGQLAAAQQSLPALKGAVDAIPAALNALIPAEAPSISGSIRNGQYEVAAEMLKAAGNKAYGAGNAVVANQLFGFADLINKYSQAQAGVASMDATIKSMQGQVMSAEGQKEMAAASISMVDAQIRNFKVYAPIEGTIGTYTIEVGGYPSQQPLSIVDITKMRLTVYLVDSEIMLVSPGETLDITLEALPEQTIPGRVVTVSPTIDASTRTYPVVIEIDNPDQQYKPGFFAKADLVFERIADTIRIPVSAVVDTGSEPFVYVLENGKAKKKMVKTGIRDTKDNIQILSGVAAGDQVITSNLSSLQDGMEVHVAPSSGTKTDLGATQ